VIHRDLKPSNVMVGSFGEVQVMDWGLAKVLPRLDAKEETDREQQPSEESTPVHLPGATTDRSREGYAVGTPTFMPPEQAKGEIERIDERADVFGLGGILCVILTGQPPYVGRDLNEVYRLAVAGEVAAAFARLDGCGADPELIQLCKECLTAERDARPRAAGVVAARLAAYQEGVRERLRQAELQRAAAEERAAGERKRRRLAVGLAAAVLALVVVGSASGLWVQRVATERREAASRQRQAIETALDKMPGLLKQWRWMEAETVLDEAESRLGETGSADLRGRAAQARADLNLAMQLDSIRLQRAMIVDGKIDKKTAEQNYLAAFADAGVVASQGGEEEAARQVGGSDIREHLVAALDDWASATEDQERRVWLLGVARRADPDDWRDRFRDPMAQNDRAALQALADELLRDEAKLQAQSPSLLTALGYALRWRQGDAVPLLTEARRRYPSDFWLNFDLGNALALAQKWEAAAGYYRAALAVRPDAVAVYNNLGGALSKGRLGGAIQEYRTALELDPRNTQVYCNLGNELIKEGQLEQAVTAFRKAMELDPKQALAHTGLGSALHLQGQLDEAIREHHTALELDPKLAWAHLNLGLALKDKFPITEAIPHFRKAVELDPKNAKAHQALGVALMSQRQLDEAILELQKAVELDRVDWQAQGNLGVALLGRGQFREARTVTLRCLDLLPAGHAQRNLAQQMLQECERQLALEEKVPALLAGQEQPRDNNERLVLAKLCLEHKKLYTAAVRFYSEAFAADAKLADDLRSGHRYNAACAAALAGCGQGMDADRLDDTQRARLRQQALEWLRADLALWSKQTDSNNPQARAAIRQTLQHWRTDADFTGVREAAAIEKLPDEERQAWQKLWADVDALPKKQAG
jgi:tetratricopeptide (TPR) repeat protein